MTDFSGGLTHNEPVSFLEHPLSIYIKRIKSGMPSGAGITGGTLAKQQAMWELMGYGKLADRLVADPGDRTLTLNGGDVPARVGLGIPIDYDIWYLYPAGNVLVFGDKTREESMEKLDDFLDALDGIKPLKPAQGDPVGVPFTMSGGGSGPLVSSMGFAPGDNVEYAIKEARFEILETPAGSTVYSSDGPKEKTEDYVGYIAFPVGPMGVMANISLATISMLEDGGKANVAPVDSETYVIQGGDLLPPFDADKVKAAGVSLMSKGYLTDDDNTVEILAEKMGDDPEFHQWLRYWIKEEIDTIIPGEFVGMLCRPWPFHAWWNQETSPLLYAGTWLETEFYASGTVKEVLVINEDFDPEDGEVGNRYKVWVKNEEILIKSSDFHAYEADEVVGLLKTFRDGEAEGSGGLTPGAGEEEGPTNFTWKDLKLLDSGEELTKEWVIVPVGFNGKTDSSGSTGGVSF